MALNPLVQQHRAWRESQGIGLRPPPSEYTPILVSHGKFPDHGHYRYGVRLLASPEKIHQVFDSLEGESEQIVKALLGYVPVLKASSSLPSNGNWITIHPGGSDTEGHPVFIVPNQDGSHTIVAGAGGKLNGLKLTGVRSEGDYARESVEKNRQTKNQEKLDRATFIEQQGQQAYEDHLAHLDAQSSRRKQEKIEAGREFVRGVLQAQGVNPAKVLEIPEAVLASAPDPKRRTQIEEAHVRGLVKYARSVTKNLRDRIITALESNSPEVGDVAYSDLVRETLSPKHPGYTVDAKKMATDRGLLPSQEDYENLADSSRLVRNDGDTESAARAKSYSEKLQAGAEKMREHVKTALQQSALEGSGPLSNFADSAKPIELQDAVQLLGMDKSLRQLQQTHKDEAQQEKQGVLAGADRPKPTSHSPIVISDTKDVEKLGIDEIIEASRANSIVGLLNTSDQLEDVAGSLYGHYVRGRYEAMVAPLGSVVPGLRIDPAIVDLIGAEGGATLMMSTVRATLPEDQVETLKQNLAQTHTETQKGIADSAVAYAKPLIEEASKDTSADFSSPGSVLTAYAETQRKAGLLKKAQEALGEAKGTLEGRAALNASLMKKATPKKIESILPMDLRSALNNTSGVFAYNGLKLGEDYDLVLTKVGETLLTINPSGIEKLRPKIDGDLAGRMALIKNPVTPTDHPPGFRNELDAQSPLHEVANKGLGDLNRQDVGILRRYWANSKGLPDDSEPVQNLSDPERKVWNQWQELSTSGMGYSGMPGIREVQETLHQDLPEMANLDLDNVGDTLTFAKKYADALGYDRVGDEILGLTDAPSEKKAFSQARHKIGRLIRSVWSHNEGAEHFDPEEVPSVSKAWTNYTKSRGSFGRAVKDVQKTMMQDPMVTATQGKAFSLTPAQQQARGLIGNTRRLGLALGAGSGKSNVIFASYLDARKEYNQSEGKSGAKRALMLVPSAVQSQFGSEWSRFVDPSNEITIHAKPGASRADKEAALRGDDVVVLTPEGWRDTVVGAIQSTSGVSADQLRQMTPDQVDPLVHKALEANGWTFDFIANDEGHRLLARAGKEDSLMANIADATARYKTPSEDGTGKLPYYVFATGDPVKNDGTEAWSVLNKIAPDAYPQGSQDAWLRRYRTGPDGEMTKAMGLAMRMEMMPYVYTNKSHIDAAREGGDVSIPLTPQEQQTHDQLQQAYLSAKGAVASGRRDPSSEAVLGTNDPRLFALARDRAIGDAVTLSPEGSRAGWVTSELMRVDPKDAPTIIFTKSREAVRMLEKKLSEQGHSVKTLTGSNSGLSKKRLVDEFQRGGYDVLVASDAAEAGVNLQRANRVINYDIPYTSKTVEQRIARAWRMGQKSTVAFHNLVTECDWDRRNLARVKRKGGLREIMTTPLELADDQGHHFWKFAQDVAKGGEDAS